MIIIVPEKSFKKKAKKWVKPKDFVIVDGTERYSGSLREYGNRADGDEFNPPPVLSKIALEPESEEAKIKARHINKYLTAWLGDEGLNIKIYNLVGTIYKNWENTGEDMNIFVILRNPIYYKYYNALVQHINDEYEAVIATGINHKMPKDAIKRALTFEFKSGFYKGIKKQLKRVRKSLDLKPEESIALKGMDDYD